MKADVEKTILAGSPVIGSVWSRVRRQLLLTSVGVLLVFVGLLFVDREAQAKQKGAAPGGGKASSLKEATGVGAAQGDSKRSHGSGPSSAPSIPKLDAASKPLRDQAPERTSRPDLESATAAETATNPVSRASDPVVDSAIKTVEPALKTANTASIPTVEMTEPVVGSVETLVEPVRGVVEQQIEPVREVVEPVASSVVESIEPLASQSPLPVEVALTVSELVPTKPATSEPVASSLPLEPAAMTTPEPVVELPPVIGPDLGSLSAAPVPDPVLETASLVAEPSSEDSVVLGNTTPTPPEPSATLQTSFSQPVAAPPAFGTEERATGALGSSPTTPKDQRILPDLTFAEDYLASVNLSQVEQAPEQAPQQPAYPGPAAPTGTGTSLRGSGFEPYNGLGLATLALLLVLSPAGIRLLRSSREVLRPNSVLQLAVERPG